MSLVAGIDGGQSFNGQYGLKEAAALAAVFFRNFNTHEAQLEHLFEQVFTENSGFVGFGILSAAARA